MILNTSKPLLDKNGILTTDNPPFTGQNLKCDFILSNIRVSTGIEVRENWWGKWILVDTFIFSDDHRQKTKQIYCGSDYKEALRIHKSAVKGLKMKFQLGQT